jgi:hypothetical protein
MKLQELKAKTTEETAMSHSLSVSTTEPIALWLHGKSPNTTTPHTKHSKTYAMILVTISTIPSWSTNYAT